ncbi:hypothetical protein CRUP_029403, partial [Coryphaenoides rupestris]
QRTLSPEENMETSSAFSPGDQHQSTATTSIKLIKQITHNGYTPDGHHVASAAPSRAAHTHSRPPLAIRTSGQPITKPSLKTGHGLSTPTTTEEANGHFLLKPCPSVFSADCFLQPTWDTVVPSESCANTTTNNDKIQESSDCSSIICVPYAAAALDPLYSVEDSVGVEERSALIPSLFPFFPPTLYFSTANERGPEETFEVEDELGDSQRGGHDWLGCWGHHMKSPLFKTIEEHQKLNHFPGSFQIGRKDRLWRNLSKMRARFGKQEFSFFPRSFILPQDIRLLRRAWEDAGARQKWIIKPPASARGTGIQVIYKWCQMPKKRPLLVQKIYVYVTSYDPLRIYIFNDGLVRFASCKALKALWQYLGAKGINTTLIWDKIKDMVIKTIIALHSNTALDVTIKGQMIRDVLNLAGFLLPARDQVEEACSRGASGSTSSVCGSSRVRSRTELSTDEKVKRAFYTSQPQQDLYSSVLDVLTPEDVCALARSEDELGRRGDFERIFPSSSSSSRYLRFFECRRYLNILLSQWEQRYASDRSTGISLLRSLCQKGVHLGTSDPAHMWSKCSYVSRFETRRPDPSSLSAGFSWRRRIHSEDDEADGGGDDEDVLDGVGRSLSSPIPNGTPTQPPC